MQIVVGHANPDFDAYAATVAATKLFPGSTGVFLGTQNVNVREFHNLHEEFLRFTDLKSLDFSAVTDLVMVDTRDPDRLGEVAEVARREDVDVIVFDHHQPQPGDITGADDRSMDVGASTSILVHALQERHTTLSPLEASVMLLGIHEDTGSLTFPGTTAFDASAAAWLMQQGADIEVLNQYLTRALTPAQHELLGQLTGSLKVWDVNGQQIAYGEAHAEEYVDSAGVLGHYIVEDLGFRVAIAVVEMPGRTQVIARSRLSEVDVGRALALLGGGGHAQAASASFRDRTPESLRAEIRRALGAVVMPPQRAVDVMSRPVRTVGASASMRDAGELMARWGHGGLPVAEDGTLVGIVTRKDVDKATRHGLGHAPVTGFMSRDVLTVAPDTDLRELERVLASRGIGRVPVMEGALIVGIVTRKDVLRAEYGDAYIDRRVARAAPEATTRFLAGVETLLPAEARDALHLLGDVAASMNVRAHVVGGFVRDMMIGRPNLDIDVVVEGDGIAYAEAVAERAGVRLKVHRRFGTAVILFARGFHVDVASARAEYYTRPGALPTVERSSLRQDLFRRDFTINAMAACLDPACFGSIADPFGGLADVGNGVVRVLHTLSFIDDPTRVLRAARFEARYGFVMDAPTEGLARRAVGLGVLGEVSGTRLREELLGLLAEEDPAAGLRRLLSLDALAALVPEGAELGSVPATVAGADRALLVVTEWCFGIRAAKRVTTLLVGLAMTASRREVERWVRHMHLSHEYADHAVQMADRGPAVASALKSRAAMRDSRLYRLLEPLSAEVITNLWAAGDGATRGRIERYCRELSHVKTAVDGVDLIALGATPSPSFSAILARALDDRMDGRFVGREAELANLSRLAQSAGLTEPRKDPA